MKTFVQIYKYKKGTNEPMRYRVDTYSTKKNASDDIRANGYVGCAVLSINELKEIYAQTNGVYFDSYEGFLIGQELCKKVGMRSYTNDNAQRIVSFFNDCVFYDETIMELLNPTQDQEQEQDQPTQEQEQSTQDQTCGVVSCEQPTQEQGMVKMANNKMTKIVNYINENGYELKQFECGEYSTHENDNSVYLEFHIKDLNMEIIIEQVDTKIKCGIFQIRNGQAYEIGGGKDYRTQKDILKELDTVIREMTPKNLTNDQKEQPTQEPHKTLENLSSDLREQPTQEPQENVDTQTDFDFDFDFDCECEYCGSKENVEFRQRTLWGKYAFMCERCLKEPH